MEAILQEIREEHNRAQKLIPEGFDDSNTQGDWVSYICAYAGRAAQKVYRNKREGHAFRACMVKVAALAVSAIQAHDAGHAQD